MDIENEQIGKKKPSTKKLEKYLGEFRIYGLISNQKTKDPIGYLVFSERTHQCKPYTVEQTIYLMSKYKFTNAEYKDGKIANTECSMDRLPIFDAGMRPLANIGITIINILVDNGKRIGYRIIDNELKVRDIADNMMQSIIKYPGTYIINAKTVNKNNTVYLSAIKHVFNTVSIDKKLKNNKIETSETVKLSDKDKWRHKKHIDKMIRLLENRVISTFGYKQSDITYEYMISLKKSTGYGGRKTLDTTKETKIIVKDVFGKKLTTDDKVLLNKIIHRVKRHTVIGFDIATGTIVRANREDKLYFDLLAQFILNKKEIYDDARERILKHKININRAKEIADSEYASSIYKKLYKDIEKEVNTSKTGYKYKVEDVKKQREFQFTEFTSAKAAASLGFAISEKYKGIEYTDPYNGKTKTLKYLGDIVPSYETYMKKANSLGDLLAIAAIDKLLIRDPEYNVTNEFRCKACVTIIIIAAMNKSEIMLDYYNSIKDVFNRKILYYSGKEIRLDIESIYNYDYDLTQLQKIYYESGFNVFTVDNSAINYRYNPNTLVNYRSVGVVHDIKHPELQDKLAPLVAMLAPEEYDGEAIKDVIGNLKFA